MPIDPKQRDGRGAFPDPKDGSRLGEDFIDDTIARAGTKAVLLDYLSLFFAGFWNLIKGILKVEGMTGSQPNDKE